MESSKLFCPKLLVHTCNRLYRLFSIIIRCAFSHPFVIHTTLNQARQKEFESGGTIFGRFAPKKIFAVPPLHMVPPRQRRKITIAVDVNKIG